MPQPAGPCKGAKGGVNGVACHTTALKVTVFFSILMLRCLMPRARLERMVPRRRVQNQDRAPDETSHNRRASSSIIACSPGVPTLESTR